MDTDSFGPDYSTPQTWLGLLPDGGVLMVGYAGWIAAQRFPASAPSREPKAPLAAIAAIVRDRRIIGDGQRSTELHVHAVDGNGIATRVPGLSWDTPDGRIRRVRIPRDGEYVAEYVPDRARERHQETVAVMAARGLRAEGNLEVLPSPPTEPLVAVVDPWGSVRELLLHESADPGPFVPRPLAIVDHRARATRTQ